MQQREKDIGDMMLAAVQDRRFWEVMGGLVSLTFYTVLVFPAAIIQELLYVGRGPRHYHPAILIPTNGFLLTIAAVFDNFAGDLVFMIWGVYFCKTSAELVWAIRRRRAGSMEHSVHYGVCIFSPFGIYRPYFALIAPAGIGVGLLALEGGTLVGLLMIFGSLGAYYLIARAQVIESLQISRENDMVIEAEWRDVTAEQRRGAGRARQRVRIR